MPLAQSVPIKQCFPAGHVSHTRPPQSTSLSSPPIPPSWSQRAVGASPAVPAVVITGDVPAPATGEVPAVPGVPAVAGDPPAETGERPALPALAIPASPPVLDESSPCCK